MMNDPAREKVLGTYVKDGLVLLLPSDREQRKIVLEYLAEDLESGRPYSEMELNFRILDHYDDYLTVRREMVAEGILKRDRGGYYREKTETAE